MITSLQLAQRALRLSTLGRDLFDVAADDALMLCDAMNAALARTFANIPPVYKHQNYEFSLDAPISLTLGLTQGSYVITGYIFSQHQLYNTILIDGSIYQVASTDRIARPFAGATGTYEATLYDDSLTIDYPLRRFVTHPQLHNAYRPLEPIPRDVHKNMVFAVGEPYFYTQEALALSDASDSATVLLRMHPVPDKDYTGSFFMERAPEKIGYRDLQTPKELPIHDDWLEAILIPFVLQELLTFGILKPELAPVALQAEQRALDYIRKSVHSHLHLPRNTALTEVGY